MNAYDILDFCGDEVVPRVTWRLSSTGELDMSSRDVGMDLADHWACYLLWLDNVGDEVETEVELTVSKEEAEAVAAEADRVAGIGRRYDGHRWCKVRIFRPDGYLTELYIPY